MSQTWSAEASGLAKRLYPENKIQALVNEEVETYKKVTVTKPLGGAGSYLPIKTLGNEANQGNISEDGGIPTGGKQTTAQVVPTPKIFVHVVKFTGLALNMLKGNTESFANTLTYQMDQGFKDAGKELNAQAFRDGSNVLVLANKTTVSSNAVACTDGVATHFRPGMIVYGDATAGTGTSAGTVVSVDLPTTVNGAYTVNLAAGHAIATNDALWRGGEHNKGLEGLGAITSTSATFMGINKSTTPAWQGLRINAGSTNLSDFYLNKATSLMKMAKGTKANALISNSTQFRMFLADTLPQVRFDKSNRDSTPNMKYTWNGLEWTVDTDCPFDKVYLLDKNQFYLFENHPLKFDESDGSILKHVAGYDSFVAYIKTYANYGTQNCGAFCEIYGLNVPDVA